MAEDTAVKGAQRPVNVTASAAPAGASKVPVKLPDPVGADLSKASRIVRAGVEGIETPSSTFPQTPGVLTAHGRLGGPDWPVDENGEPAAVAAYPFSDAAPKDDA